jgi:hypothetical protein
LRNGSAGERRAIDRGGISFVRSAEAARRAYGSEEGGPITPTPYPSPYTPTRILKRLPITIPSYPTSDVGDDVRCRRFRRSCTLPPPWVSQIGVDFSDQASFGVELLGFRRRAISAIPRSPSPPLGIPDWRRLQGWSSQGIPDWRRLQPSGLNWRRVEAFGLANCQLLNAHFFKDPAHAVLS